MVKDFTPARTSLSSGVVIKQNLLERNKQAPPSMSYTTPEYSGSVKSFARDYQVPNSNKRVPGLPSSSAHNMQLLVVLLLKYLVVVQEVYLNLLIVYSLHLLANLQPQLVY